MFQSLRSKLTLTLLMSLCISLPISTIHATTDTYKSVLKIKVYSRDSLSGNYSFSHYGSAVLIDSNRIITNAHVILDADNISPTGYYELCKSENTKKVPTCFSVANLVSYDTIVDLAILTIPTSIKDIKPVVLGDSSDISLASSVVVYGYPAIGGSTVTRTEGKIGGTDGDKYKFDGTIDYGNSGGGAFDTTGKLIGIPYAVKSDNGMIGYIIPTTLIKKFLLGKTDNLQTYGEKVQKDFTSYIKNMGNHYKNGNLLKTKYIEIKNAAKAGFTLYDSVMSNSGDIFTHRFVDSNKRVFMTVSCSRDASTTWMTSIDYQLDILKLPIMPDAEYTVSYSGYTDEKKNAYMIEYAGIKEEKGQKFMMTMLLRKDNPNCVATAFAADGAGKDKAGYQKAITLIKSIKFTNTIPIAQSFNSSFFNLKTIPKNIILSESSSPVLGGDIRPSMGIIFPGEYVAYSSFEVIRFDDIDGYMNYEYSDSNRYTSKDYSFDAFYKRYRTVGYSNITDFDITTKDGKKLIMTVKNYDDTSVSPVEYEQQAIFFYPFMTKDGDYMAYRIEFTLHSKDGMDKYALQNIISEIEFPGVSPFQK